MAERITQVMWRAADGTVFDTEGECKDYESSADEDDQVLRWLNRPEFDKHNTYSETIWYERDSLRKLLDELEKLKESGD